tara:strand:- start:46 stop:480 length:435 start_codon:yes stop_codon:yes gene_type:complete
MNKPVAPDWMKEVVRKCDGDITKLDPPVKKEIRAFIKKVNKWERIQKRKEEEEERIERNNRWKKFEEERLLHRTKEEDKQYEDLLRDQENTIDWNRNLMWKCDCGCESFRVVKTPHLIHYGKYQCNLCHKHHGWVPRPQHDEDL